MPKEPLLIDVHIPFCPGRCVYCEEKSFGQNIGYLHRYLRALETELRGAADELGEYDVRAVHLHPDALSLFGPGALDDFLTKLEKAIPATDDTEWVVEAMPGELTDEMVYVLQKRHRIDRVVLELMGFTKEELKALHRPYTENIAMAAIAGLAETPVRGLDLSYGLGLPGQTSEQLTERLNTLFTLSPQQITLRRFHNKRLTPTEQREYAEETDWAALIRAAERACSEHGYQREGRSLHFARPDCLRYENSNEAAKASVMGFGIGAVTRIEGLHYRNTTDFALYLEHADDPAAIAGLLS